MSGNEFGSGMKNVLSKNKLLIFSVESGKHGTDVNSVNKSISCKQHKINVNKCQ